MSISLLDLREINSKNKNKFILYIIWYQINYFPTDRNEQNIFHAIIIFEIKLILCFAWIIFYDFYILLVVS